MLPPFFYNICGLPALTTHIFPWSIIGHSVDRDFWLTLLGCRNRGWLSDKHLDIRCDLMWKFRQPGADWAIVSLYLCACVMRADVPFWLANGIKYHVPWIEVDRLPSTRLSHVYLIRTSLGECEVRSYLVAGLEALNKPSFPPQRDWLSIPSRTFVCSLAIFFVKLCSYKGTNLLAVGMDGNNQILPIAMGVTYSETGASWTWFMNRLKECIGEVPNLCNISDRHPTIILAYKTVSSNYETGASWTWFMNRLKECIGEVPNLCIISDRHPTIILACKKIRGMYWKTFKAYTTHEFDALLAVLRGYRPDGVQKLEIASFDKWPMAYCPANCFNYMTSNSVESVNSLSRFLRKLPITRLVEYFKGLLQRCCKSEGQDAKEPKWQLSDLPCNHVCAVSRVCGLTNCNLWAQPWFMNRTLKDTYRELVYLLKDAPTWEAPNALQQGTQKQKRRSNNTHITHEPLTREALLGEERARNGWIYQDWDDLVEEEILPVSVTENFMRLREWDGPAEWRQCSYNQMNNFMPTARYSSNNTYDPTQPSSSHGYMLHRNAGESSTPYESYHLDDM
uniref:MULE transposase domain-containing protein n=1 Tax=Tanacetum cinerariifolium TaxID=118510 RepID=A0A699HS25_TANCI|nr:hypothetical protein [Tanacetum cinerariifolium]